MKKELLRDLIVLPVALLIIVVLCASRGKADSSIPTANLVLDLQAGVGVVKDSSNQILSIADQSGAGNNVTGATDNSSKPIDTVDADGKPVIRFAWAFSSNHPKGYLVLPSTLTGINPRNTSVYVVAAPRTVDYQSSIVSFSGPYNFMSLNSIGSTPPVLWLTTLASNPKLYVPNNKAVLATVGRSNGGVVRWNDTQRTTTAPGVGNLTGGAIGRHGDNASQHFSGDVYRVLIYNTAHDDATIAAITAQLEAQYGVVTTYTKQVVIEGDSLTAGAYSTNLQDWPNQLRMAHPDWLVWNEALSGAQIGVATTSGTMAAEAPVQVDQLYNPSLSRNVLALLGGTNDIGVGGQSGSQTFTRLVNYLTARKALGYETWVITVPDRGSFDTQVHDYNALIRSGNPMIDKVIDVGKDSPTETRLSNSANSTYYYVDQLHLVNAGYGVIAELVGQALGGVVTPPPPPTDTTAPTISAISSGTPGQSTATITWTTDEPADTQVEYGLTTSYGSSSTLASALGANHSVTLSGLSAGTSYHFRVKSRDAAGNLAISADQSFMTAAANTPPPPSAATRGTCVLSVGNCTVATTAIGVNSLVLLTAQDTDSAGTLYVASRTPGTSFVVMSHDVGDHGVVAWEILEP